MIPRRTSDWLLFFWLTAGYAVVHVVIAAWGFAMLQAVWPDTTLQETLRIAPDGTPFIQTWNRASRRVAYRTLDGADLPDTDPRLQKQGFSADISVSSSGMPRDWDQRIDSFLDGRLPTTNWYLVAPPDGPHAAYFVGYDQLSRQRVGFLGIQGFSVQPPTWEQSFVLRMSAHYAFYGAVVAAQRPHQYPQAFEPRGRTYYDHLNLTNAAQDEIWILSLGDVYRIRLGERSVKKLIENRPDFQRLTRVVRKRDNGTEVLDLIARTETGVEVIDPATGAMTAIPLPRPTPDLHESLDRTKDGQWIVLRSQAKTDTLGSTHYEILWLDDAGQVERREELTLRTASGEFPANANLLFSLLFPSFITSAGACVISPFGRVAASSYGSALAEFAWHMQGWLAFTVVTGVLLGWACRRREREVFARDGWLWPIAVGLFGWFGWIGYICLRPLPARLPSGRFLPAQPEPNRSLGTEIFA